MTDQIVQEKPSSFVCHSGGWGVYEKANFKGRQLFFFDGRSPVLTCIFFLYTGIISTRRQWLWIHQVVLFYEYTWMFPYTCAIQWPGDALTSSVSTANCNAGLFCCHGCHLKMKTSQNEECFFKCTQTAQRAQETAIPTIQPTQRDPSSKLGKIL